MFDIGFWELIVIAVLGLFILGPERLPGALHSLIKWMNTLKRAANQVTTELQQEVNLKKLQDDLKSDVDGGALGELNRELKSSVKGLRKQAADIQRPIKESLESKATDNSTKPEAPKDVPKDD